MTNDSVRGWPGWNVTLGTISWAAAGGNQSCPAKAGQNVARNAARRSSVPARIVVRRPGAGPRGNLMGASGKSVGAGRGRPPSRFDAGLLHEVDANHVAPRARFQPCEVRTGRETIATRIMSRP